MRFRCVTLCHQICFVHFRVDVCKIRQLLFHCILHKHVFQHHMLHSSRSSSRCPCSCRLTADMIHERHFMSQFLQEMVCHANVTASVSWRGNHAITAQCLVKNVPPAPGGIIHAISRFLSSRCNKRRMTCIWWQLTHNITIHTIILFLKESCHKINVTMFQLLLAAIWQLIRNPSVDIPSVCLGNLSIPILLLI